jgi:multiple sugar transport system permease protein
VKNRFLQASLYAVLIVFAAVAMFPLIYTFTNSFIGASEFAKYYGDLTVNKGSTPFHLIPDMITFDGYKEILVVRPHYLMKFWISLLLSASIMVGQIIVAVLGGYAFSRFRFPGRNGIFFVLILIMMMPYQVTLVPNYIIMEKLGLIGSYASIILSGIFSAFGVFLMRQVMDGIPTSILESAQIDGAGSFRRLCSILLPNCKAGISALMILSFADSWNMVEQPLVFLRDSFKQPLSVFLTRVNEMNPEVSFACGLLSILPVFLLFLHDKDEMIRGIEYSTIK